MAENNRFGRPPYATVVRELRRTPGRKRSRRRRTGAGPEPGQHGQTQDPPHPQRP
jgi:hypothetical protein